MQIGSNTVLRSDATAPITVHSIDKEGGEATIDSTPAYPGSPVSVTRRVRWTDDTVTVEDRIILSSPEPIAIRFHTPAAEPAAIERGKSPAGGARWSYAATVAASERVFSPRYGPEQDLPVNAHWVFPEQDILRIPETRFDISSDQPLRIENRTGYNHTLKFRRARMEHTVLTLSTEEPVLELHVTTRIAVDGSFPNDSKRLD